MNKITTALLILLVILIAFIFASNCGDSSIPKCAEDVVVIGVGQFDNGYWTDYICGPALDDFLVRGEYDG